MAAQKNTVTPNGACEFELQFNRGDCRVILRSPSAYIGNSEKIQVIEKAAYDASVAELADLKAKKTK